LIYILLKGERGKFFLFELYHIIAVIMAQECTISSTLCSVSFIITFLAYIITMGVGWAFEKKSQDTGIVLIAAIIVSVPGHQ